MQPKPLNGAFSDLPLVGNDWSTSAQRHSDSLRSTLHRTSRFNTTRNVKETLEDPLLTFGNSVESIHIEAPLLVSFDFRSMIRPLSSEPPSWKITRRSYSGLTLEIYSHGDISFVVMRVTSLDNSIRLWRRFQLLNPDLAVVLTNQTQGLDIWPAPPGSPSAAHRCSVQTTGPIEVNATQIPHCPSICATHMGIDVFMTRFPHEWVIPRGLLKTTRHVWASTSPVFSDIKTPCVFGRYNRINLTGLAINFTFDIKQPKDKLDKAMLTRARLSCWRLACVLTPGIEFESISGRKTIVQHTLPETLGWSVSELKNMTH